MATRKLFKGFEIFLAILMLVLVLAWVGTRTGCHWVSVTGETRLNAGDGGPQDFETFRQRRLQKDTAATNAALSELARSLSKGQPLYYHPNYELGGISEDEMAYFGRLGQDLGQQGLATWEWMQRLQAAHALYEQAEGLYREATGDAPPSEGPLFEAGSTAEERFVREASRALGIDERRLQQFARQGGQAFADWVAFFEAQRQQGR